MNNLEVIKENSNKYHFIFSGDSDLKSHIWIEDLEKLESVLYNHYFNLKEND